MLNGSHTSFFFVTSAHSCSSFQLETGTAVPAVPAVPAMLETGNWKLEPGNWKLE
jgi:hypothetical protein